jgi:PAS domain S-box-containing protein
MNHAEGKGGRFFDVSDPFADPTDRGRAMSGIVPPLPTAEAGNIRLETLLSAIVETSDDAIFTCDTDGKITSWGATAERLFGCRPDEVVAHRLATLFPEHLRGAATSVISRVLAGDRIKHFETEVQRPDGMPMPVSLSLSPIFVDGQRPAGLVVIARDITEQRLAQAALAEVTVRLQEGEALAHVGSWLWDLRTGTVQWSNEFHRIHGVDPLDFGGTFDAYLETVFIDDRARIRDAMEESVAAGRTFEGEYRIMGRDLRVLHVRAQPTYGSDGAVVGLRGIGQDVTEAAPVSDAPY